MESPIVLIRKFEDKDKDACKEIIAQNVEKYFWPVFVQFLFRETLYEVMILVSALGFVFFGVPLKATILAIPFVLALTLICIKLATLTKQAEMTDELKKQLYFVAELHFNGSRDLTSGFFVGENFENLERRSREVIGMIWVEQSAKDMRRAFLKRCFVKPEFERTILSEKLVGKTIEFCKGKYDKMGACCAEINELFRETLFGCGFEISVSYTRFFCGLMPYLNFQMFTYNLK